MFSWWAKPRKPYRFAASPFTTIDGQIITLDEIIMKVADLSHEVECLKAEAKKT